MPRMTEERAREAFENGARTAPQMAEVLGLSERQALRWLNIVDPDTRRGNAAVYTPEQYARVEELARDEVPTEWIAEDAKVSYGFVENHRKRLGIPYPNDYKKVYQSIRWQPTLLALHREFAP